MWPGFLIDHMFFRKRHRHVISEWTLGLIWWKHWTITDIYMKPAYYLKLDILKHVVSRDIILKNSVHGTSSVSWRNLYDTVSHLIFPCHFTLLLKENFSMWVTSGFLSGSTSVTHFQPCWRLYNGCVSSSSQLQAMNRDWETVGRDSCETRFQYVPIPDRITQLPPRFQPDSSRINILQTKQQQQLQ